MRWRILGIAAVVAVFGASACGSGITKQRLNAAVGGTFANLYALQMSERGSDIAANSMHVKATCKRGTTADQGAGDNWTCLIVWHVEAGAAPSDAQYSLRVQTNGCYTAEGDGPASINGQQTLVTATGKTVTNPLWRFDGCFDVT